LGEKIIIGRKNEILCFVGNKIGFGLEDNELLQLNSLIIRDEPTQHAIAQQREKSFFVSKIAGSTRFFSKIESNRLTANIGWKFSR